jgi:1L-myo-inositol 1-phosphate cytidylyltransferase / CDP-L-myo-inositol myo-inositolphosphotransferase
LSERAILVLVPSEPRAPGAPNGESMLLGLRLAERAARSASRAGFDRTYVLGDREIPELSPGRIVLLADWVVATPAWLRQVREAPAASDRVYRLGTGGGLVETREIAPLENAFRRQSQFPAVMSDWAAAFPASEVALDVPPPLEATTSAALADAETQLLESLRKKEDGILTRLVSRRISLAVTRFLAPTSVTPNAMTFVCLALGLAAAVSFASPSWGRQVAGGVLFLLHSILDGCDGELARLKFRESRFGGVLDFWADNTVHVAVFSAFALAWSRAIDDTWPLWLGVSAVAGTVACAAFVYLYAMRPRPGGGPLLTTLSPARRSRLTGILDALARRDFIYLVMVLALFGKAYWMLAPTAVGTPAFFLALAAMSIGASRRRIATA